MYKSSLPPIPSDFLNCKICEKKYNKLGSHASCYKRYCWICSIVFDKEIQQQTHSKEFHSDFYCTDCKECITNIQEHKNNKVKWCNKKITFN